MENNRFGQTVAVSGLAGGVAAGCSNGDAAPTSSTESGTEDASASTQTTEIKSIGLMVQDMSNPFFSAMEKGAKDMTD